MRFPSLSTMYFGTGHCCIHGPTEPANSPVCLVMAVLTRHRLHKPPKWSPLAHPAQFSAPLLVTSAMAMWYTTRDLVQLEKKVTASRSLPERFE